MVILVHILRLVRSASSYLLGLGFVSLAACFTYVLSIWSPTATAPFFTAAVVLSAWYGGLWPAVFAAVVAAAARTAVLFLLRGSPFDWDDVVASVIFILVGASLGTLIARTRERDQLAREALTRANLELERNVQERTVKLRETIADLEQFSYSVSHDLRAPLRSMSSFSRLLLDDYAHKLEPEAVDYLGRIASAATRMDKLIMDVLTYSRVARCDLELASVDLDALVQDIVEQYPHLRPQEAEVFICSPLLQVQGNHALLTQCVSNLLGNAVKFVAPGVRPQVRLWTVEQDGWVQCNCQDNGIGIPSDKLDRVWRIFERGHHQSDYQGTGIGLSIVKRAVERMGGTIGVHSIPGQGSTFWFKLRRP
jgi:signal transduction histidine kinase